MTYNSSFNFFFDINATSKVYLDLDLKFENLSLGRFCVPKIESAFERHNLKLGIDFSKPWAEITMEEYYQIEYLFVGEILGCFDPIIDEQIGINFFRESRFGMTEFGTENILNLTCIIDRI